MAADPLVRGSCPKNASIRAASKPRLGGSCHRIGPNSDQEQAPEAKKFASGVSLPLSFFMCVVNRLPLTQRRSPPEPMLPTSQSWSDVARNRTAVDLNGSSCARPHTAAPRDAAGRADRNGHNRMSYRAKIGFSAAKPPSCGNNSRWIPISRALATFPQDHR